MTRNEIEIFLKKNKLNDFSFHGLNHPSVPNSVIITIDKIQVRIQYAPSDSLEHFKELIDQHYRSKLRTIDPEKFNNFKGFRWKNDFVGQD